MNDKLANVKHPFILQQASLGGLLIGVTLSGLCCKWAVKSFSDGDVFSGIKFSGMAASTLWATLVLMNVVKIIDFSRFSFSSYRPETLEHSVRTVEAVRRRLGFNDNAGPS